MKNSFKPLLTIISLYLLDVGIIIYSINRYFKLVELGMTSSLFDILFIKGMIISYIPIILSLFGPLFKNIIGWILSSLIFYFIAVLGFAAFLSNGIPDTMEFIVFCIGISPLALFFYLFNSYEVKEYYNISKNHNMVTPNVIGLGTMLMIGLILIFGFN